MTDRFTPTVEQAKQAWLKKQVAFANVPEKIEFEIGFDNMIEAVRKEAQIDALREAADELPQLEGTQITRQQAAAYWLRDRANEKERA